MHSSDMAPMSYKTTYDDDKEGEGEKDDDNGCYIFIYIT
jgi:hypothetical protein